MTILGDVARKHKIRKYEEVVSKLFNEKLSHFLGIVMVLNQSGMIILYEVILYKLLGGVINELFDYGYQGVEEFAEKSFWSKFYIKLIICYLITGFILSPLCLL